MNIKHNITYTLAIVLVILFVPSQGHGQQSTDVYLGGYKMEPSVQTSGSGMVTATLKKDSLIVKGDFKYLTANFSGAYIMFDIKKRPDNQLFSLKAELNKNKRSGTFKAEKNRFKLSESEKKLLKKGRIYIIVSSFEHQNGEIRGNIRF